MAELVAGEGLSLTQPSPPSGDVTAAVLNHDPNTVIVRQASDLSGTLDSSKQYYISGHVDLSGSGVNIEVPAGGLTLVGASFDNSKLICSDAAYQLFTSPVGGSGNLLIRELAIEITGAGSSVYALENSGFPAVELIRVNYNDCTSLGYIDGYRQGLESGTGRFGGSPELELRGAWAGGYFIDTSIVRSLDAGFTGTLFKAGAGFTMQSRFRSNQNIDLPASASILDFSPTNFPNPSTLDLEQMRVSRNGVVDATDSNLTPNVDNKDLCSSWTGNIGLKNTFEGGGLKVTSQTQTNIVAANTWYPLAVGSSVDVALVHFDTPANNELRLLGVQPREYVISGYINLQGTAGDNLEIRVLRDTGAGTGGLSTIGAQVISNPSGPDRANFVFSFNINLEQNYKFYFEGRNLTGQNNFTLETDSYWNINAR